MPSRLSPLAFCLIFLACLVAASPSTEFLPNPSASIEGRCTFQDVESANNEQLGIILKNMRDRDFFRWFMVDLEVECNFWKEEEVKQMGMKTQ